MNIGNGMTINADSDICTINFRYMENSKPIKLLIKPTRSNEASE